MIANKRGITLLALGKYSYAKFAYNMALTLKFNSPDIPIQLICEPDLLAPLKPKWKTLFDIITPIEKDDAYYNNRLEPGLAKLNIYKYLAFDETIYLDVDGVCIAPVEKLFELCTKSIHAQIVNSYTEKDEKWDCLWMALSNVKKHYKLPKEYILPELDSSFLYIKKSKTAEKFFAQARKNFRTDIDRKDFGLTWGATFPDELALNIAFAQVKHDPKFEPGYNPIYFKRTTVKSPTLSIEEIKANHFFIGLSGSKSYNHNSMLMAYDRFVREASINLMGENPIYKAFQLMEDKHVLNKK